MANVFEKCRTYRETNSISPLVNEIRQFRSKRIIGAIVSFLTTAKH